ncbi:MAG TPA: hypothetical protein VF595_03470 [Tepidisphaeraceae bacterium]
MKGFNDSLAAGVSKKDAFFLALEDAAKKLPLIGGIVGGLSNLAAELNGDADMSRTRAKNDQKAVDNAAITNRLGAMRDRGKSITTNSAAV